MFSEKHALWVRVTKKIIYILNCMHNGTDKYMSHLEILSYELCYFYIFLGLLLEMIIVSKFNLIFIYTYDV